ncbi:serine/threonine-protein kinase [Actinomadura sp. 3N407]|uniref:serine/threonine-protein kinase n=1 Tax=Actinomadura sp. 3N407 TaxID=3457423 RepID=UPI003FCDA7FD
METLQPEDPRRIGDYHLLARLGAGGMGSVFLGRSASGRMVAVKFVHAELARDPDFRRRFQREVEAARRVSGRWTAPVLDADTESVTPWVATGYVAGPTLQEAVGELHGPLPERSVLTLAAGLAQALRAVHDADLIHRDLKPSNVLLTLDGPRVIDFGIARATDGTVVTATGMFIGTPGFVSPEQARGELVTPAGDVFSLGAVLVYAATGRQPFATGEESVPALLFRVVNEPPELDGMTGRLRELAERCLAKDPGERPSPVEILAAAETEEAAGTWLPGELVEHVGRRAVELLDLERPEDDSRRDAPTRRFAAPADRPPAAPPPPARPSPPPPLRPMPPGYGPGVPGRPHPGTTWPPAGGGAPGRRPATVPLAVAVAALSAVLLAVMVVVLLPDGGDGAGARAAGQNSRTSAPAPTETPDSTPRPSAGSGAESAESATASAEAGPVPAVFIGTWEGEVSGEQTRRMVIKQGPKGTDIVTTKTTSPKGYCEGKGKMISAGPNVLEVSTRMTKSVPSDLCKGVGKQTLTLKSDDAVAWDGGFFSKGTLYRQ